VRSWASSIIITLQAGAVGGKAGGAVHTWSAAAWL
jgi:hypothetical protein